MPDKAMRALANVNSLKWLEINSSLLITDSRPPLITVSDEAIGSLAKLPRLTKLILRDVNITDRQLKLLTGASNLEALFISDARVSLDGLKSVNSLAKLRYFCVGTSAAKSEAISLLKTELPNCDINVFCKTERQLGAVKGVEKGTAKGPVKTGME